MNFQTGFNQTNFAPITLWDQIGGGLIYVETMSFFEQWIIVAHIIPYKHMASITTKNASIENLSLRHERFLCTDVECWAPSLFWKHVFMFSRQVAAWSLVFSDQVLGLFKFRFQCQGLEKRIPGAKHGFWNYFPEKRIYIYSRWVNISFLVENNLLDCQASFVITTSSCYELNT